ncbi:MAG: polysaccharide biosynthesis/export family protein [Methanococcaceae archaeon]
MVNMPEPVIQANDLLSIRVFSASTDPKTDIPYNLPDQVPVSSSGALSSSSTQSTGGVLVDVYGNIDYPRIGAIHAEGLTRAQLAEVIKSKLRDQLKDPTVLVRFQNFRVTVLGEVKQPGTFNLPTERITILEALGLAGDISEFGKKSNVKVARENKGSVELGIVDLTKDNLFASPFFRLQQNDVVIVENSNIKAQKESETERNQTLMTRISLATSLITTVAIILNIFK